MLNGELKMFGNKLVNCVHKDNREKTCIFLYCPLEDSKHRYVNAWLNNKDYCVFNEDYLRNLYDIALSKLEDIEKREREYGLTHREVDILNELRFTIMNIEQKLGVQHA